MLCYTQCFCFFFFSYNTNAPKHKDGFYTLTHMAYFFIIFPVSALWWSLPVCKNSALPPAQPTVCQRLVFILDSSMCHTNNMNYDWCLGIADRVSDFQLITLIVTVLLFCCFLLKVKIIRHEEEKFTQKWAMNVHLYRKCTFHLFLKISFSRCFYPMEDLNKSLLELVGRAFIWFTLMVFFRLMPELILKKTLHLS